MTKKPTRQKRTPAPIPTTVDICGVPYTIRIVPEYLDSSNIGLTLFAKQEIQIFDGAKEDARKKTLLHEIVHAIIYEGGCYGDIAEVKADEGAVQGIANGFYSVLRNNPQLVTYLTERK